MHKLIILLFIFKFGATAQSNFKKGFIAMRNGDTLRGEIDFSMLNFRNNEIYLKYKNTDSIVVFNPNNCNGFGIDNEAEYLVKSVKINLTEIESNKPDWEILPEKLVFLKILSKGKLNLYSLNYLQNNSLYFIEKQGNSIDQLIYHTFSKEYQASICKCIFLNQLYFSTKDKSLSLHGINYNDNSIYKFVERYNNLSDKSKIKKIQVNVGFGGTLYSTKDIFENAISPAIFTEFIFPILKKKNSITLFVFGLNYNKINLTKKPNNSSLSNFYRLKSIQSNILSGNTGVLISPFYKYRIQPYIGAGVGYNITFGNSITNNDGSTYRVSTRSSVNGDYIFNKNGFRFYYKVGLKITKKWGFEGKFDKLPSSKFSYSNVKDNLYSILIFRRI